MVKVEDGGEGAALAGGDATQAIFVVRLRGLPYTAKSEDLEQFFGESSHSSVPVCLRSFVLIINAI